MKRSIDYNLIWKSVNHELTKQEQELLDAWLKDHINHREYYKQLREIKKGTEWISFSDDYKQQVWTKLELKTKKQRFGRRQIIAIASAASIAMLLILRTLIPSSDLVVPITDISIEPGVKKATLVLEDGKELELATHKDTTFNLRSVSVKNKNNKLNYSTQHKKTNKIEFNKLLVPRGGEYFLQLSDGSRVWINSETVLRYPVAFAGKDRVVELNGEAYFEVEKDHSRPFIVKTGEHSITVLGTSFNVNSYSESEAVVTTLVEGSVQINAKSSKDHITLSPNMQSVYKKDDGKIVVQEVDVWEFTSWKDGRFYFRNMELKDMLQKLGRWYNVKFVFDDPSLKNIKFNGNLARTDNIKQILDKLRKTNEITFTAYGNIIHVN